MPVAAAPPPPAAVSASSDAEDADAAATLTKGKAGAKRKRATKVKAKVVANARKSTLVPIIQENVAAGSTVYTDSLQSYNAVAAQYVHDFVNHAALPFNLRKGRGLWASR